MSDAHRPPRLPLRRHRRTPLLVCALLALLATAATARAQPADAGERVTVHLLDGGSLTGKVAADSDATRLVLIDESGQRHSVELTEVASMVAAGARPRSLAQQIADLSRTISIVENTREILLRTEYLGSHLEALGGTLTDEQLQALVHEVRSEMRLSAQAEDALDTAGIGYELRRIAALSKETCSLAQNDRFVARYLESGSQVYQAVSALDAATETLIAAREGAEMGGGEALRRLGNQLSALEDAAGLLGLSVNPVITAMVAVYAKALIAAGTVAEEVIEPRTREVDAAIDAAGEALGGARDRGEADAEPLPVQRILAAYDRILADLRRARQELEARDKVDYWNARKHCFEQLDLDFARVFHHERALLDASHRLERIARRLAAIDGEIQLLAEDPPEPGVARYHAPVLEAIRKVERLERRLANARANESYLRAQLAQAREALQDLRTRRRWLGARRDELLAPLREAYDTYRTRLEAVDRYGACLRRTMERWADDELDQLPPQYRDPDFYALSPTVRAVVDRFTR